MAVKSRHLRDFSTMMGSSIEPTKLVNTVAAMTTHPDAEAEFMCCVEKKWSIEIEVPKSTCGTRLGWVVVVVVVRRNTEVAVLARVSLVIMRNHVPHTQAGSVVSCPRTRETLSSTQKDPTRIARPAMRRGSSIKQLSAVFPRRSAHSLRGSALTMKHAEERPERQIKE